MSIYEESVKKHRELGGKLEIKSKIEINNKEDLSLAYTPGVAQVCREIDHDPDQVYELSIKKNSVAVITDGSAVLGLGNIGPEAALPVMEGKAILFKEYADIDAYPICLDTQDTDEIIDIVKKISPGFGGINLEDIGAPRCFEIEEKLQDLGIPVFHDDQHGTAIVLLAAIINAGKLAKKDLDSMKVVINGAGAAGTAIARILQDKVQDVIVCDSKGIISKERSDIAGSYKESLAHDVSGSLQDALTDADVFVGVSVAGVLNKEMIQNMNERPIIFAMANPEPEIMPEDAKNAGAFIVGTGRSDFPNQINNVLAFPGIFRGALNVRAKKITGNMKLAAAHALADSIEPDIDAILPSPLNKDVAYKIAKAVEEAAFE